MLTVPTPVAQPSSKQQATREGTNCISARTTATATSARTKILGVGREGGQRLGVTGARTDVAGDELDARQVARARRQRRRGGLGVVTSAAKHHVAAQQCPRSPGMTVRQA